jgi:hypothetical protein
VQLRVLLTAAFASVVAASCATTPSTTAQGAPAVGQHNVVTAEELARVGDLNLQEALQRVRPTFLRPRQAAATLTPSLTVFLDGLQMMEGLDHLREIASKNVQEVRFLEPHQANARFGGSHSGGALVITSKR